MQSQTNDIQRQRPFLTRRTGSTIRPAFSMTEMVFAIFILGLGLLFTSSMFPIAWFKARTVFETTNTRSSTAAGIDAFHRVSKVNGPNDLRYPVSKFFPDEWVQDGVGDVGRPVVFPNTRVHVMTLGNYLASPNRFETDEPDNLNAGGELVPVASSSWQLSDQLALKMGDSAYVGNLTSVLPVSKRLYTPDVYARDRLLPPMAERPDPADPNNATAIALWDEQFSGRRYCWAVLYRFSRLFGPDVSTDPIDPFNVMPNCGGFSPPAECEQMRAEVRETLAKPREMTVYYVTLKRPEGARYVRQEGIQGSGGAANWQASRQLDHPRALPDTTDVLLPSPWRFEATLTATPALEAAPTGIPSEIRVTDQVLADMLVPKTFLIDERNGQIYRITQRRNDLSDATSVVLALDKEYTALDVHRPNYTLFPKDYLGNDSLHQNWKNQWEWIERNCDNLDLTDGSITNVNECIDIIEDEPAKRYYWVFPPPVEVERAGDGIPIFAGSPPVVDIETRQVVLRPRL